MACPKNLRFTRHQVAGENRNILPEGLDQHVTRVKKAIRRSGIEFEAIAFMGMSGALVAGPLALALQKPLIEVRKDGEVYHGGWDMHGPAQDLKTYIIVDDVIDTGKTVQTMKAKVRRFYPNSKLVGVFLYQCLEHQPDDKFQEKVGSDIPVFNGEVIYPY